MLVHANRMIGTKVIVLEDKSRLHISQPSIEDASNIINFLNKVGGETDFLTFGLNDFKITEQEEKRIISECLNSRLSLMLIGKINQEIISHLLIERTNKARLLHFGYLSITVAQAFWNKSVASCMLIEAIKWSKENSITKLQLQVRTDNNAAINLYHKFGFQVEGKITRAIRINNTDFDEYSMGLQL